MTEPIEHASRALRQRRWWIGVAVAIAVAAAASAWLLVRHAPPPNGLLQINGRIEGDRITLASKLPGRIVELGAREGDVVTAGQPLVRLEDRAARARLDLALAAHGTLQAQVAAQQLALSLLRAEVKVAVEAARTRVVAAEADARRAEAAAAQEARDHARAGDLSAQGFIGPQALERAGLALTQAQRQQDAARAALQEARQALLDAELGPQRVRAREAEVAVTRARLKEAEAAVAEALSAVDDLTIAAPAGGTVTLRFVDVGEVVAAGTPLLEIVDLGRLYLKGYLPETLIGRVHRGMPARIHVDAWPGVPFEATVRYVASRAEFTPKEVQTLDERVKLVYEVRLYADSAAVGRLTPGQPADGVIRWREDLAWRPPAH